MDDEPETFDIPFPTLRRISMVKIITTIFSRAYGDSTLTMRYHIMFSSKKGSYLSEICISRLVKQLDLPSSSLKTEIQHILKCMCCELYEWRSTCTYLQPQDFTIQKVSWLPHGKIDRIGTFRLNVPFIDEVDAFVQACDLCLKDYVDKTWKRLQNRIRLLDISQFPLVEYWMKYAKGGAEDQNYYNLFKYSATGSKSQAAKYFWTFLTKEEQDLGLAYFLSVCFTWAESEFADVLLFFLRSITENQKRKIFALYNSRILQSLILYWPCPNFGVLALRIMCKHNCIADLDYVSFLRYVLFEIRENYPIYKQQDQMFLKLWRATSDSVTLSVQAVANLLFDVSYKLYVNGRNKRLISIISTSEHFQKHKSQILYTRTAKSHYIELIKKGVDVFDTFLEALQLPNAELCSVRLTCEKEIRLIIMGFERHKCKDN